MHTPKTRLLFIILLLLLVGFVMVPVALEAAKEGGPGGGKEGGPGGITIPNPLKAKTFEEVLERIANFIFILSIPITTIVFLAGAYQFMTAAGDPEKLQRARATLLWAAIGFALVLISFSVTTIVREVLEL